MKNMGRPRKIWMEVVLQDVAVKQIRDWKSLASDRAKGVGVEVSGKNLRVDISINLGTFVMTFQAIELSARELISLPLVNKIFSDRQTTLKYLGSNQVDSSATIPKTELF